MCTECIYLWGWILNESQACFHTSWFMVILQYLTSIWTLYLEGIYWIELCGGNYLVKQDSVEEFLHTGYYCRYCCSMRIL